MSLKSKLEELLPSLLPNSPREAIKGNELIAKIREVLPGEYTDASLRFHFSALAADSNSSIVKIPRKQGYYLRQETPLQPAQGGMALFSSAAHNTDRNKALALMVRYFDTTGKGVFVFSTCQQDASWTKPDFAVVQWPDGHWESNALILEPRAMQRARHLCRPVVEITAVCVAHSLPSTDYRREFFRTLSTCAWASRMELMLIGDSPDDDTFNDLQALAATHGVGITVIDLPSHVLLMLPAAGGIIRAEAEACGEWLDALPEQVIATSRLSNTATIAMQQLPYNDGEFTVFFDWISACIERGRVENYEFRVSCI